ncbi:unnamed protein product [Adineta steineri]|uniref:NAD(P)(+)--arginine ADP-ribosyltransferase n=1 Tax=Adineta steineri TaxID=433720 RepID=A0A818S4R1_9BILA|nr:unnamed protein product [Adineta steineri]
MNSYSHKLSLSSNRSSRNKSSSSSQHGVWYYNSGDSSDVSWNPFSDIDNEIIEDGFCKNEKRLELDDYYIDLDKSILIDKQNSSIQKSIKRCIRQSHETPLRSERFYTTQKLVKSCNNNDLNDRRFINEWKRRYTKMSIDDKLEQAANGIIKEGMQLGKQIEAEWIAQQLRSVKSKSNVEMEKCIILLYTHESFLYRLINTTLRENDQSKIDNLGAFAELLSKCDCSSSMDQLGYAGELYRGAQLDEQTIESYRQSVGQTKTWDAFSSTSKNRKKAESFGNVLFIINRDKSTRYRFSGMDISSISHYPEEEEVLIRAARNFTIEKFERDDLTGKYRIFLLLH